MEQYPSHVYGFIDGAGYWADIGECQKARDLLEKARETNPKSLGPLLGLGKVSVELKDYANARKYFEEVLKLESSGAHAKEAKEGLRKLKKVASK